MPTITSPTRPTIRTAMTAVSVGLSWTAPSGCGLTGYSVTRVDLTDGTVTTFPVEADVDYYSDSDGINPCHEYRYTIIANNECGSSAPSVPADVWMCPCSNCCRLYNYCYSSDSTVTINWSVTPNSPDSCAASPHDTGTATLSLSSCDPFLNLVWAGNDDSGYYQISAGLYAGGGSEFGWYVYFETTEYSSYCFTIEGYADFDGGIVTDSGGDISAGSVTISLGNNGCCYDSEFNFCLKGTPNDEGACSDS